MVSKLDEIQGVVLTTKCEILVVTESWLSSKMSDDLITIPGYVHVRKDQKTAVKIILPPQISYETGLAKLNLTTLAERRQILCYKLYISIVEDEGNKIHELMPEP